MTKQDLQEIIGWLEEDRRINNDRLQLLKKSEQYGYDELAKDNEISHMEGYIAGLDWALETLKLNI